MLDTEVKALLQSREPSWQFEVRGEGRNFQIDAISDDFAAMPRVKRQQAVYRLIADEIAEGTLHAITIAAMTPDEWNTKKGLGI